MENQAGSCSCCHLMMVVECRIWESVDPADYHYPQTAEFIYSRAICPKICWTRLKKAFDGGDLPKSIGAVSGAGLQVLTSDARSAPRGVGNLLNHMAQPRMGELI